LKDKIKALAKYPFFWIVVAIGFIGISILVVSMISGKDKCPPGTSRGQCGDKCVPACPGGKYDCSTNKCVCPDDETMCNGECCPAKECINGLCCSKNRQCPIGPGGEMQCCPNGEICDPTSKTCVSTCAVNGNECKSGESCLTVGPINQALQDKFKKDFPLDKYPSALCVSDICSVCVPESKCQFDENQPSPAALKESSGNIGNYYPCTNIINGTDENGDLAYCSSDVAADALACNEKTTKAACTKEENCKWRNIFDVTYDVVNKDIANIGSSDPTKIAYEGNWCGNPGKFLHVDKMSQSKSNTGCDVTTCWNELNKHPNVIDIHWDDVGKVCTSVAYCDTGVPVGFSSPCTVGAKPSICDDSGYKCATTGEITKSIPDACTGLETCMLATNVPGESGIGWCINETAPGVYDQRCALSETACKDKGPGAIFVNSSYLCPYKGPDTPGTPGCGPNNYLSKSGEAFSCVQMDPTPHNPHCLCGSCDVFSGAGSVRTLVFNRTRWSIIMDGVTGDGKCTHGKTCDNTVVTIEPYTMQQYDAGGVSMGSISPECDYTATFPAAEFGADNKFIISVDMHDKDDVSVTPPNSTSSLAKSVRVTYRKWEYYNIWVVSVIFYPAWEMSPNDAAITWPNCEFPPC
jgi:hypothetical protein